MKKSLVFLFSALLLLGLFVSCDNSVNANKGLVTIKLGAAVGKDLTTSTDYVPFDTLDWYYMASTESEEFNFGETADFTKLNNLGESIELSQGIWDFELIAVPAGTATLVESAVMYAGDVENVLVTTQADGDSLTIDIPVFANMAGFGYISFGDIKIVLREDGSNAAVAPNYIVIGDEEGDFTPSITAKVPTGTYSIKLCYVDPNDDILKAEETVEVTVYSGATTTISGIISEVTQDVVFDCIYYIPTYESLKETLRLVDEARIILTDDIVVPADTTIKIESDEKIAIALNGYTIMSESQMSNSNRELFLVHGELTLIDGTIVYEHFGDEMGWNSMSTIFDVTNGGVLNLYEVYAANLGGTAMNFVIHLNNWGDATANIYESRLEADYITVRAFNSGNGMNNLTIKDTYLEGKYCFWVHNYIEAGDNSGRADTLNVDIYDGSNHFVYSGTAPVLYGFNEPLYFDEYGRQIVTAMPE